MGTQKGTQCAPPLLFGGVQGRLMCKKTVFFCPNFDILRWFQHYIVGNISSDDLALESTKNIKMWAKKQCYFAQKTPMNAPRGRSGAFFVQKNSVFLLKYRHLSGIPMLYRRKCNSRLFSNGIDQKNQNMSQKHVCFSTKNTPGAPRKEGRVKKVHFWVQSSPTPYTCGFQYVCVT